MNSLLFVLTYGGFPSGIWTISASCQRQTGCPYQNLDPYKVVFGQFFLFVVNVLLLPISFLVCGYLSDFSGFIKIWDTLVHFLMWGSSFNVIGWFLIIFWPVGTSSPQFKCTLMARFQKTNSLSSWSHVAQASRELLSPIPQVLGFHNVLSHLVQYYSYS